MRLRCFIKRAENGAVQVFLAEELLRVQLRDSLENTASTCIRFIEEIRLDFEFEFFLIRVDNQRPKCIVFYEKQELIPHVFFRLRLRDHASKAIVHST